MVVVRIIKPKFVRKDRERGAATEVWIGSTPELPIPRSVAAVMSSPASRRNAADVHIAVPASSSGMQPQHTDRLSSMSQRPAMQRGTNPGPSYAPEQRSFIKR